jgi:hypothetical protein
VNSIIAALSGAPQQANAVGGYYDQALQREINASGSPAAKIFGDQTQAALQPRFDAQNQALSAKEAAMGITHSGAAKADFGNLAADQSATLAGAIAPLYSSAMNTYGQINASQPGAQGSAYQQAIAQFYQAMKDAAAASAGVPPMGGTPTQTTPPIAPAQSTSGDASPYGLSPYSWNGASTGFDPSVNPYAGLPPPGGYTSTPTGY